MSVGGSGSFSYTAASFFGTFTRVDAGSGALPKLRVEVDFDNDPTGTSRTWTEITGDVRSLNYTRSGRNDVLQRTSTGTLSMVLDNASGNYDPSNAASIYAPGPKRMRWIRVIGQWNGTAYPRWQGLITSWVASWPQAGKDSTVSVTASDALKVLNLTDIGGSVFPAQRTDERVSTICTLVNLDTSVSTGQTSVVESGTISPNTSALSHLQDVEDTENGRLYADAQAQIIFQDRHWRLLNSASPAGTIGDAAGEIPYTDTALTSDDANIWNDVTVTPSGGTAQVAGDTASQTAYFPRSLSRSSLSGSSLEALSAAQYLVQIYKNPSPKLPQLSLQPARGTATWPTVLSMDNSQRIRFRRRPRYGGTIETDGFVEQISETIVPGESWVTSVQLNPCEDFGAWLLGDSVYGLLDQTTILTY